MVEILKQSSKNLVFIGDGVTDLESQPIVVRQCCDPKVINFLCPNFEKLDEQIAMEHASHFFVPIVTFKPLKLES